MLRFGIRCLVIAFALLLVAPRRPYAQVAGIPDSVAARMIGPALIRLLEYEIARAAFGGQQVMKLELPDGIHWSRLGDHILRIVNGRRATKADSAVLAVGVRDIRLSGDTLIASLLEETRELCDDGKWMRTGTAYEARTVRVVGGGWTRIAVTPGMTWDGWCLRTPNEELKPTALASEAAGSLRSPAALLSVRCGLTPAR